MWGKSTENLFKELPNFEGLSVDESKRMLSLLYLDMFSSTVGSVRTNGTDHESAVSYLRRMINALEFQILSRDVDTEVVQGMSFVAAEGLALMSSLLSIMPNKYPYRLADLRIAVRVESALLYLAAGFDANAKTTVSDIPKYNPDINQDVEAFHAEACLDSILALCCLEENPPLTETSFLLEQFQKRSRSTTRALLFNQMKKIIFSYLSWISMKNVDGLASSQKQLKLLKSVLEKNDERGQGIKNHPDIYHLLKLIECVIDTTSKRSLHIIPYPSEINAFDFEKFLQAKGSGRSRRTLRPLLWPGHVKYVNECLPGPSKHAVVSIPTGSGKSFLAELAISHAASNGWALYLVPTNALANQVRADLESAFDEIDAFKIKAFLGSDSLTYSTTDQDRISEIEDGTVAVMTPEKCALALRLSPESFSNCRLCIFDECHLISESQRGVLAELVLGHIMTLSSDCNFIFLSALMSNSTELSHWLENVTQKESVVIDLPWRPTRSMRGLIGVDKKAFQKERKKAFQLLSQMDQRRTKLRFQARHVLVANLQGPWINNEQVDYARIELPTLATFEILRDGTVSTLGWINNTVNVLAHHIGTCKLPVLAFLPQNKHHSFSVGQAVGIKGGLESKVLSKEVVSLLEIAVDELGTSSMVGTLLSQHISIHTSALLECEKRASEIAFKDGSSVVMFATGTMAQGLNLPASIVLIGGTIVGDIRQRETSESIKRSKAQILNALGRAGRAGYSNHGLGIVITEKPLLFDKVIDLEQARQRATVLQEDEDSTIVESRLEKFLNEILSGNFIPEYANTEELAALTYLPMLPDRNTTASDILSRSFAIFRRSPNRRSNEAQLAGELLADIGTNFIQQASTPDWVPTISYRTGMPFFLCWRMIQAFQRVMEEGEFEPTLENWLTKFFQALSYLPPIRAKEILKGTITDTALQTIFDSSLSDDDPNWLPPAEWLAAWKEIEQCVFQFMHGNSVNTIAKTLLNLDSDIDSARTAGSKPIPRTIEFFNTTLESLGQAAGILVAIHELVPALDAEYNLISLDKEQFAELATLPIAIRHGCISRDTLAWFRFGIRYRRAASLLAKHFPIPFSIKKENEIQKWINNRLNDIRNNVTPAIDSVSERRLFDSVRSYLQSSW